MIQEAIRISNDIWSIRICMPTGGSLQLPISRPVRWAIQRWFQWTAWRYKVWIPKVGRRGPDWPEEYPQL